MQASHSEFDKEEIIVLSFSVSSVGLSSMLSVVKNSAAEIFTTEETEVYAEGTESKVSIL